MPKKVQTILNQNNLSLIGTLQAPKLPRLRYFVGLVRDGGGRKGLLKVLVSPGQGVVKKFKTEVKLLQEVDLPFLPKIRRIGPDWYLREYIEGDFGGSIVDDFGFKRGVFDEGLIRNLVSIFKQLQSRNLTGLEKHGYEWYKRDFGYYASCLTTVPRERLERAKFFLRSKRRLLDAETKVLAHGDLYPGNFVKTQKRRLRILDWELLNRNNSAFDVCFVWMLLWAEPRLQKLLREDFERGMGEGERETFGQLFRVCQVSLALRFIRHSEIMLGKFIRPWQIGRRRRAKAAMELHQQVLAAALGPCTLCTLVERPQGVTKGKNPRAGQKGLGGSLGTLFVRPQSVAVG